MRSRREPLIIFGSARSAACHAADDGRGAVEVAVVDLADRVLHLAHAGHHAEQVADRAHPADRLQLVQKVLERELVARWRAWPPWHCASSSSKCFCACSIRVSMSPIPRMREAIRSGWKTSKSSSFSPLDANMIGWPVTSRTDSAAPPRASPSSLVSTTPVKPTPSCERLGGVHRVLPDHGVDDEQHLLRVDRGADVGSLLHQLGVDAEAAGGVDDAPCRAAGGGRSRSSRVRPATGSPTPLPGCGA